MLFSPTAKHAIRALIHLATKEGEGPILGKEIAETEQIPKPFLAKILHDLRVKGLIRTTKGPGGGYQLARPSEQIRLIEIINAIDGELDLESMCILGLDSCDDHQQCALHEPWSTFRDLFSSTITDLTLAEAAVVLIRKRGGLTGV